MQTNGIGPSTRNYWILVGVLAAIAGGLLALGCERRDDARDVATADVRRETLDAGAAAGESMKKELADLEKSAEAAERDAKREIDRARDEAEKLPDETRRQLDAAIDRTERARNDVSDRLDELKDAGETAWQSARQRMSDALEELARARREVAAALRGDRTTG
jgi:acetyl-CoA carboxylase carboxyltransferase component